MILRLLSRQSSETDGGAENYRETIGNMLNLLVSAGGCNEFRKREYFEP